MEGKRQRISLIVFFDTSFKRTIDFWHFQWNSNENIQTVNLLGVCIFRSSYAALSICTHVVDATIESFGRWSITVKFADKNASDSILNALMDSLRTISSNTDWPASGLLPRWSRTLHFGIDCTGCVFSFWVVGGLCTGVTNMSDWLKRLNPFGNLLALPMPTFLIHAFDGSNSVMFSFSLVLDMACEFWDCATISKTDHNDFWLKCWEKSII